MTLSSILSVAKLLVATGSKAGDFATLTEIIDLKDATNVCQPRVDFPFGSMDGTGLLLDGSPLICGGYVRSHNKDRVGTESPTCILLNSDDGPLVMLDTPRLVIHFICVP